MNDHKRNNNAPDISNCFFAVQRLTEQSDSIPTILQGVSIPNCERILQEVITDRYHSIYSRYVEFLSSTIYCFHAHQICQIIELRLPLVEANMIPLFLSFQEIISLWIPLGIIQMESFPINEEGSTTLHPYTFISHEHYSPDKLGPDVTQTLGQLGTELIWIDLCSMFQPGTLFPGYNYELHTKPVVHRLHKIIKQASRGVIALNISNSNPEIVIDNDPLKIKAGYDFFVDNYERFRNIAEEKLRPHCYSMVPYFHNTLTTQLNRLRVIGEGWFPTNKYFGRLWCYVERLGMDPSRLSVYPGNFSMNVDEHLKELKRICDYLPGFIPTESDARKAYDFGALWRKVVASLEAYEQRIRPLFGTSVPFPHCPVLGPYAQLQMLDCFCDSDRVIVAEIEAKLRNDTSFNAGDWLAGLQICMNSINRPIGRVNFISHQDYPSATPKLHNIIICYNWAMQALFLGENNVKSTSIGTGGNAGALTISIRGIHHSYICQRQHPHWTIEYENEFIPPTEDAKYSWGSRNNSIYDFKLRLAIEDKVRTMPHPVHWKHIDEETNEVTWKAIE